MLRHGLTRIDTDWEEATANEPSSACSIRTPGRCRDCRIPVRSSSVSIRVHPWLNCFFLTLLLVAATPVNAHHFKGLPHYNYFENYPQVPEEEFLGQAGAYELSLVVYDFQGINREKVQEPDNVRLFLLIFNLRDNSVYQGSLTLELLDHESPIHAVKFNAADLENIYSLHRKLADTGKYSLRLTLHDENDMQCVIPFLLSTQKIHWGKWVGLSLLVLIAVAAIGARKARIAQDRRDARQQTRLVEGVQHA